MGEKEAIIVSRIPQIIKEKGEIVYQALGWLAKEGEVDFHKKGGKTFVSLNSEEREIFKRSLLQSIAQYFEEENMNAGVTLCEEGASAERFYVLQ